MTANRITLETAGGVYEVEPEALDAAMAEYLPASPASLRAICAERLGVDEADALELWPVGTTVTRFLMVLAEWDYAGPTNDVSPPPVPLDDVAVRPEQPTPEQIARYREYVDRRRALNRAEETGATADPDDWEAVDDEAALLLADVMSAYDPPWSAE